MRRFDEYPKQFKPWPVQQLSYEGIEYIEQAQALSDEELLKIRGVGKMFIYHLRQFEPGELQNVPKHELLKSTDNLIAATVIMQANLARLETALRDFNQKLKMI